MRQLLWLAGSIVLCPAALMLAMVVAAQPAGDSVSDEVASTLYGGAGCPGWFVDQCKGKYCGTTNYVSSGQQNFFEQPNNSIIDCGGDTQCVQRTNSTSKCASG